MDGEHVFSASIVLVMVCFALPTNPANTAAMNAGLEILRGMAERGNSYMGARRDLLIHLWASASGGANPGGPTIQPSMPPSIDPSVSLSIPLGVTPEAHTQNFINERAVLADGPGGGELPFFSMADAGALKEVFYDKDETRPGTADQGLWEAVFANSTFNDGSDLRQWTQAAQIAADKGVDM